MFSLALSLYLFLITSMNTSASTNGLKPFGYVDFASPQNPFLSPCLCWVVSHLGTAFCSLLPVLYTCWLYNPLDRLIEVLRVKKDWQSPSRCFILPQKWHLIEYFSKSPATSMSSPFNPSKPIVATHPCTGSLQRLRGLVRLKQALAKPITTWRMEANQVQQ